VIVVCGEALIDLIRTTGGEPRASPGGGPFNTARALARLGVPTAFLGHLSKDGYGRGLSDLLRQDGVSVEMASFGPEPTTMAIADVDTVGVAGYRFVIDGTSAPNLTPDMVPVTFAPQVNGMHIGTLGVVLEPMADTVIQLATRERGRRLIMLDPNIRPGLIDDAVYRRRLESLLASSTIVKASEPDLEWMHPGAGYRDAAGELLTKGVRLVAVTLGAEGAFGAHRRMRVRVDAPAVEVVDTVGAGDAFGAGLLAWLHDHGLIRPDLTLEEDELRAALDYACRVASLTCARAGANPPRKDELRTFDRW
jgi:fructokinase